MNNQMIDAKLKHLIQTCMETNNYKKLAVVSFMLTSNRVNEIGIYLGVRPREKALGEKIFEYMNLINEIFEDNLRVSIFRSSIIEKIQENEILFLKSKGDLPLDHIKQMYSVYYDLRDLEVPNLHKSPDHDQVWHSSKLGAFSFLSPEGRRKKERNSDALRPLILQKIREREIFLQKKLQRRMDSHQFETAIYLRSVKNSLTNTNKVTIHGALKDNLTYQRSIESVYRFFILGVIILLISLGAAILIELSFFPLSSGQLSTWALILFGCGAILIYYYIKQVRNGR
jgi:hypothetical protein